LDKTYRIKVRCYWEYPWETHWEHNEHVGNLMRTHWELEGNRLGTNEKNKNSPLPTPLQPQTSKKTNQGTLSAC